MLEDLIDAYLRNVAAAVDMLVQAGIPLPDPNYLWLLGEEPQRGKLRGGFEYRKHGIGCIVSGPGFWIDFDFGVHGEINCFNPDLLFEFSRTHFPVPAFQAREDVMAALEAEVTAGRLRYDRRCNLYHVVVL